MIKNHWIYAMDDLFGTMERTTNERLRVLENRVESIMKYIEKEENIKTAQERPVKEDVPQYKDITGIVRIPIVDLLCGEDCDLVDLEIEAWPVHDKDCSGGLACCGMDVTINVNCKKCGLSRQIYPDW